MSANSVHYYVEVSEKFRTPTYITELRNGKPQARVFSWESATAYIEQVSKYRPRARFRVVKVTTTYLHSPWVSYSKPVEKEDDNSKTCKDA